MSKIQVATESPKMQLDRRVKAFARILPQIVTVRAEKQATKQEWQPAARRKSLREHWEMLCKAEKSLLSEAAENLAAIRDQKLYKLTHKTFDEFCRDQFKITRNYANRLLRADRTARQLTRQSENGATEKSWHQNTFVSSLTEGQLRPLTALPAEDKPKALADAQQATGKASPPAKAIEAAAAKYKPTKPAKPKAEPVAAPEPDQPKTSTVNGQSVVDPPDIARMREKGIIAPDAVVQVVELDADQELPVPEPEPEPAELTDEEYLDSLPLRAKLEGFSLQQFDVAAKQYRMLQANLRRFRREINAVAKTSVLRRNPFMSRLLYTTRIEHPKYWIRCAELEHGGCGGTGLIGVIGKCPACHGAGFRLNS